MSKVALILPSIKPKISEDYNSLLGNKLMSLENIIISKYEAATTKKDIYVVFFQIEEQIYLLDILNRTLNNFKTKARNFYDKLQARIKKLGKLTQNPNINPKINLALKVLSSMNKRIESMIEYLKNNNNIMAIEKRIIEELKPEIKAVCTSLYKEQNHYNISLTEEGNIKDFKSSIVNLKNLSSRENELKDFTPDSSTLEKEEKILADLIPQI